jgi:hypothetical protein
MTTEPQDPDDRADDLGKQDVQTGDHGHDQTSGTGTGARSWDDYSGPVWSAAEAARRCNISRSTLTRRLAAGDIPGAVKTDTGWHIPAQGLALAGLAGLTPPDPTADSSTEDPDDDRRTAEVAELRAQLAVERVKREGAEQLAAERADYIRDLRSALLALTPPKGADNGHQDTPTTSSTAQTAVQDSASTAEEHQDPPTRRRGLLARVWGAITEA